ncbi:hypothetical protein QVD17_09270 [Tagetes erecta]|uniref:Uncharacterized protein n=1 Tax=Tagetes erecta TaxID=13708 RepID=A0AAD8KZ13_TARER|nr:hypothetical protein QVD17_09270 [Tagetes erecta]
MSTRWSPLPISEKDSRQAALIPNLFFLICTIFTIAASITFNNTNPLSFNLFQQNPSIFHSISFAMQC